MSRTFLRGLVTSLAAFALSSGLAFAQSKVTLAIGGASCLCYLPTMLADQLGEYKKAGVEVEIVQFKGGSDALKAVMGGSADVVSGYFDHCVNLAAKGQRLQSFVVYDRFPGWRWWSPGLKVTPAKFTGIPASPTPFLILFRGVDARARTPRGILPISSRSRMHPNNRIPTQPLSTAFCANISPSIAHRREPPASSTRIRPLPG